MELSELNKEFGKAEQARNAAFFEKHLADHMVFRRASGVLSNKAEFLAGLVNPALIYHTINTEIISVNESSEKAVVKAVVTVDMTKDNVNIQGSFTNIRFFEKQHEVWKLITWFNEKAVV